MTGGEMPFDIDYRLVEKDTGRIDRDYLNNNFQRYIRLQEDSGDPVERERVKNDLHRFFATLTADQQRYANMVINDLENGELAVEDGKEFIDYINDYQERTESDHLKRLSDTLHLDEERLERLMNSNIDENNINEFGRFSKLKDSVDKKSARSYLEGTLEEKLKPYEVSQKVDRLLRDFILEDGFDVDEYVTEKDAD